ncbi:DUF4351 domain-containing protein [Glycomyces sp. NRRL B-16210]|uniref:DUF4351 domain-containing protein n=1 Tax=Glycomyces sp. NRRL B-16210 TaxID=1463821 RepID=UPI000689B8A7|nr:DUF4351 domain-containing protein [Glycomyces sp. NRRL B-16210]
MTTYEHEAPLRLLQYDPKLAEALYCGMLGRDLPEYTEVRPGSEAMTRGDDAVIRNCDNVAVYYSGDRSVFALLFEVQRGDDDRKRYTWLDYIASARSRLRCPVALVVLTFDASTARWAAGPIDTGHPGLVLRPLVLGPDNIPVITDPAEGRENVSFALLSLIAHGHGERGAEVMRAYYETIRGFDRTLWSRYAEYALNALQGEQFMSLQEMIMSDTALPNTYRLGLFGEKYREGLAEGRLEGRTEGEASMLLRILEARGIAIEPASRERIRECASTEQLEQWADNALAIERIEDLFV